MRMTSATPARATYSLVAACVAAFLITLISGMETPFAYAGGFIPARLDHPDLLDGSGLTVPLVPFFLTPLTATLLHGGWLHLFFNLLIFVFCGKQVEMVMGGRLFLLLYAVGAYAAAFGQFLLGPQAIIPMIGASGAISAIIGSYSLLFSNKEVRAIGPIPAPVVRMLWLGAGWVGLQFLIGVASGVNGAALGVGSGDGIAIGAHIGGFIAGMVLTRPFLKLRFRRQAAH